MRKMIWSLMSLSALSLALTGCGNGSSTSQKSASSGRSAGSAAAIQATKVTGTITLRDAGQPSDQAQLVIDLVDVSAAPNASTPPLATKTVAPGTQFPVSFELDFNAADVNPNDLYVVKANLTDGERHYSMALQAPVLTKGSKNEVSIQLIAQQTPGEKDLAAFEKDKQQIGGMKIKQGTKLEKGISRSWQVFRQDGVVQFIREQVEYDKKESNDGIGFTDTDYDFKDGKPFVAVQQQMPSKGGKASLIERVSWSSDGTAVLKQSMAGKGGKVSALSDDEVGKLNTEAENILKLAGGDKAKSGK